MFCCICFSVTVTVQTDPPNTTIFAASPYVNLVCNLDIANTNGVDIAFTWTGPNGIVSSGSDYTITDQVDNSTLHIEPLNVRRDHNAMYICSVVVVSVQGNNSLTLGVQGMLNEVLFEDLHMVIMQVGHTVKGGICNCMETNQTKLHHFIAKATSRFTLKFSPSIFPS